MASEFESFFHLGVDCQPQMHMQKLFVSLHTHTYTYTRKAHATHTHTAEAAAAAYRYLYLGGTEVKREHIL